MSKAAERHYRLLSGVLASAPFKSDGAFLDYWRGQSQVTARDQGEWRHKMVRILKDATTAAQTTRFDSSTPESFCRSLVMARILEVSPPYDAD